MKKIIAYMCMAVCMVGSICAKDRVVELDEVSKVVVVTELTTEMSEAICRGEYPNVAIECPAGIEIPVKFKIMGEFFSFNLDPSASLKLEKLCYFRFSKKKAESKSINMYSSFDLKAWRKSGSMHEGKASAIHDGSKTVIEIPLS